MTQLHAIASIGTGQPITATPADRIAIIGGGLSGTLVAVHLLKTATAPLTISLIERRAEVGQGIAYSTPYDCHLLNVPAGKMSAFADEPNHFVHWLQHHTNLDPSTLAQAFVPRKFYGQYLQFVLKEVATKAPPSVRLDRIRDEAIALTTNATDVTITLKSGATICADRVVLALGNLPPQNPPVADPSFYTSDRYIQSPWSPHALDGVETNDAVLLIGSGLTALDWVMALHQKGHQGNIYMVSRRGVLPCSHQAIDRDSATDQGFQFRSFPLQSNQFGVMSQFPGSARSLTVRQLLRWLRQEIQTAAAQGQDWRVVIDALRPHTQALWQALPQPEQRRFLRHVRVYWDSCRHRVAPAIAAVVTDLIKTQHLHLYAGQIQAYAEDTNSVTVTVRQRSCQTILNLRVAKVINCTGFQSNYCHIHHPLIQTLLSSGMIVPDALSLGLNVDANGALIDAFGHPSPWLYTLGSVRRGTLWESTAVKEIRDQAKTLALELLVSSPQTASNSLKVLHELLV